MIIEKDGQIIVTELRPMSEVKNGQYCLCFKSYEYGGFEKYLKIDCVMVDMNGTEHDIEDFMGFAPLPIYQPQQKPCEDCGAKNAEESKTKCLVTEFGQTCDGMKFYD